MDTALGKSSGKHPERRNYMFWPGIIHERVSGKDAWYEGAGIYRGGVSLYGT